MVSHIFNVYTFFFIVTFRIENDDTDVDFSVLSKSFPVAMFIKFVLPTPDSPNKIIFTFIIFFFYWYIVTTFCEVYPNTQMTYIKDCIFSFIFSFSCLW